MPDRPSVSVLIPTYNYAHYLPTALDSVLAQTFDDYEIIVSDDASADDSAEVLRRYAARDPRIRIHVQSANLGLVGNWNWCLRQARGDYIKFLFADDCLVHSGSLASQRALLEEHPGAVLATSARLVIDERSRPVEIWSELPAARLQPGRAAIALCLWRDKNLIGEPSAVLFRRAAAARGFDPQLRQLVDLEFWFHLLLDGDLCYDSEPLCSFRVHAAQQTVKNRQSHIGPTESLQITARYLAPLLDGAPGWRTTYRRSRILHRCLHYSRKRAPRLPQIIATEAALDARLTQSWRLLCWAQHRLTKPFDNLAGYWRRHIRRHDSRRELPSSLRNWLPPSPPAPIATGRQ